MLNAKKYFILALLFSFSCLVACESKLYNETKANIADTRIDTVSKRREFDRNFKPSPSLLVKGDAYVDTTPVNLEHSPSWLKMPIVIRGDRLPFSYYSRLIANGAGTKILTRYQNELNQSLPISMNYSGNIQGALDLLASRAGYQYDVQDNLINWQALITKTFEVAFMPGSSDYLLGKKQDANNTASSSSSTQGQVANYVTTDSSESEYSNISAKLSIWKDLESTIKQMLSPEGKVVVSESTTSVTISDHPTNVQLVSQYIANMNSNLSKQVLVKIQVLEVNLNDGFSYGINWGLIANAFSKSKFILNANYGTPLTITPNATQAAINNTGLSTAVTGGNSPTLPSIGFIGKDGSSSYTTLINALNQQGKTSIVSEPRVVCMNNQVSVVRITTSEGYIASVQNTTSAQALGQSIQTQVTPGTLTTGLTLYILPKILGNRVYLQINADLSTKVGLEAVTGSLVQLPEISQKHFNQRSILTSNATMVLSGFRQVSNNANAMQFANSQALGGKGSEQNNRETIVLITPIILNGSI